MHDFLGKIRFTEQITGDLLENEFYAVITPDGKWYAEGDMGWFGCSSATPEEFKKWCEHYKEIFLDNADPKWILTIVDCHI